MMVEKVKSAGAVPIGAMDLRVAALKASATLIGVGPVPVAPARGAVKVGPVWDVKAGGTRRLVGHRAELADVFDRMILSARERHDRSGSDAPFAPPFTPGQTYMARHYRALTERYSAGGVRCSSAEAGRAGGDGGGFMDAYMADGCELSALHRRIGTGSAMVLRRIRPSARGSRTTILDRRLVDLVCLGGQTLSQVLRAHGWSDDGKHRDPLRQALCAALDRMQGYR
jgi:hypothetical protein